MIKKMRLSYLTVLLTLVGAPLTSHAQAILGNTFFAGTYQSYSGERENSLAGINGYGLTVISTPHYNHFRLIYGATLSYVDGRGYLAGNRHGMTGYSADAIIGMSIYPIVAKVKIRPFFELGGIGGFKYLEVSNPPTGVEGRATGLSGGYRLSIGLETNLSFKYGLRISADYNKSTSSMLEANNFSFDNFAFSLGFFF